MPVSHGYDESFNQSLQNALFNLSKTGQTDFILSTQLRENQRLVGLPFYLLVFLFCLKDICILSLSLFIYLKSQEYTWCTVFTSVGQTSTFALDNARLNLKSFT